MTATDGAASLDDLFDAERVARISSELDLRAPNREALESIAWAVALHYDIQQKPAPFRGIADVATGVGKTYVMAGVIEYFADEGVRNFAVITPGTTILRKTVAQFTAGTPKSLLKGMEVAPLVITSENFASPMVRAAMDDPDEVKLFVFTVQSLTKPTTKQGKKTHEFNENLGAAFYQRLTKAEDLFVIADEEHCYHGPAFSKAVDDLEPRVLLGLTATPHSRTPEEEIVFRYPLAAAIADKLVKTPVLVGRKDDRSDPTTKLLDGISLLELKAQAVAVYSEGKDVAPVTPLMLVVAQTTAEADEIKGTLEDPNFLDGRYQGKVLVVHSSAPDEALEALDKLEEPGSPYTVVVSVGMLKEGWDNKSVYVLASMRASVSTILTEQTLGRGLRLPFGEYTGIEILDTLEVLGHERYEQLLRKANVLNEQFVDRRTRAVLVKNAQGQYVPTVETTHVSAPVIATPEEQEAGGSGAGATVAGDAVEAAAAGAVAIGDAVSGGDDSDSATPDAVPAGVPTIVSVEDHTANAQVQVEQMSSQLVPTPGLPSLKVPRLKMGAPTVFFSLADITNVDPFRKLGTRIASDPEKELRRTRLSARRIKGKDGLLQTELVTAPAVDRVTGAVQTVPLAQSREHLLDMLLTASVVPARAVERNAAQPLLDALLDGLGDKAEVILSAFPDRAAAGLIELVTDEHRKVASKPTYSEVVELNEFNKVRTARAATSTDLIGLFSTSVGYEGYKRSMYVQDWFHSSTERKVANIIDAEDAIKFWVRLQNGDLPILWTGAKEYNPDFVVVENDGAHWIVEVKMNAQMKSEEVAGKREAAQRWANYVNADVTVEAAWHYLLLSEDDVDAAKGSWEALKSLGA
ncbi:MAG TPA: DEAD/DEAH box helicase family protein [Solirubrobacteraceae bacterium]|nr:DEAD/DEAH box helicase family protein [Solirubrobacteraceae bacterium]